MQYIEFLQKLTFFFLVGDARTFGIFVPKFFTTTIKSRDDWKTGYASKLNASRMCFGPAPIRKSCFIKRIICN